MNSNNENKVLLNNSVINNSIVAVEEVDNAINVTFDLGQEVSGTANLTLNAGFAVNEQTVTDSNISVDLEIPEKLEPLTYSITAEALGEGVHRDQYYVNKDNVTLIANGKEYSAKNTRNIGTSISVQPTKFSGEEFENLIESLKARIDKTFTIDTNNTSNYSKTENEVTKIYTPLQEVTVSWSQIHGTVGSETTITDSYVLKHYFYNPYTERTYLGSITVNYNNYFHNGEIWFQYATGANKLDNPFVYNLDIQEITI